MTMAESVQDWSKALRVEDRIYERKVIGSTTVPGKLTIQWGKWDPDFNKIPFTELDEALKLGKAYLLQEAARLRDAVKLNNTKIEVNGSVLKTDGDKWEEEVMTSWKTRGWAILVKD